MMKEKYNCIIIDDEYSNTEVLQYELNRCNFDIDVVKAFEDPVEALKYLRSTRDIDVLFLDIEMPRLSGFDLLDLLGDGISFSIIFVTAYNEYAIRAFEYYAVDYLLKPININRLNSAIGRAIKSRNIDTSQWQYVRHMADHGVPLDKVVIPISEGYEILSIQDISRMESDGNYTSIYKTNGEKLYVAKTLKQFELLLADSTFYRIHQSHLINMNMVSKMIKIDGGYLIMKDGAQVPMSRRRKSEIINLLKDKSV